MGCFFRIIMWAIWVNLIFVFFITTIDTLPCGWTMHKCQMYVERIGISEAGTGRKSYNRQTVFLAYGKIVNSEKPVVLNLSRLMKKTNKFGAREEFKATYVNTDLPLEVFVCKSWITHYDRAYADLDDGSVPRYSFTEWLFFDLVLLAVIILIYILLTRSKKIQL